MSSSQACWPLWARPMGKPSWEYGTWSWAGAENWYQSARVQSGRTDRLGNVWYLLKGDVHQADWDQDSRRNHFMFVSKMMPSSSSTTWAS